jgi:hypothetical protein
MARIALAMAPAEMPRAAVPDTSYPFASAPAVAPALKVDPDTKVSRGDLAALAARILDVTADLSGAAALLKAARILRGWLSARPSLDGSDWGRYLTRLARGLRALARGADAPPFGIFGEDGNGKLPFTTFGTLPVFSCPNAGDCATWCYSLKAWRYPAAFARQLQNTLLLRFAPDVVRSAFLALPQGITFRLFVDGDFGSIDDVAFWMACLRERPDVSAYGYSKSWDLLLAFDRETGGAWPTNYRLNLSSGGRAVATAEEMMRLPITRGAFVALPLGETYKPVKRGTARYDDGEYYRAVRQAAERAGYGKRVFLCPGACGSCTSKGHACALPALRGVPVLIGVH